jgi:deoxyribonuclease V
MPQKKNKNREILNHSWDLSTTEARSIQLQLAKFLSLKGTPAIQTIAGVDISCNRFQNLLFAAIVVLSYPDLATLETAIGTYETHFPYIPGFLSFREGPAIEQALKSLTMHPDLFMFDGQGIAHPQRMGLATHMGIRLATPSIGCAKSLFIGTFDSFPLLKGNRSPLVIEQTPEKSEQLGYALCTRDRSKPLFVSPGHQISHHAAVEITLACTRGYKLPEPTRLAHLAANDARRSLDGRRQP